MIAIISQDSKDNRILSPQEEEVVLKGLRMLLLVGNDRDTMTAARLLDILLA
jgi:hypothetical protein